MFSVSYKATFWQFALRPESAVTMQEPIGFLHCRLCKTWDTQRRKCQPSSPTIPSCFYACQLSHTLFGAQYRTTLTDWCTIMRLHWLFVVWQKPRSAFLKWRNIMALANDVLLLALRPRLILQHKGTNTNSRNTSPCYCITSKPK